MKQGSGILIKVLFATFLMATVGCASHQARGHRRYKESPRPYPAVRMNFGDPDWPVDTGDGFFDFDPLASFVILPFDLPVSIVTDTLLLPVDIVRWRGASRGAHIVSNALYGADRFSPEKFARHYKPVQSARVVHRYLTGPTETISPEKLDMLLDAGVDTVLLTKSRRLDDAFAKRLLDEILQQADSRHALSTLARNSELPASTLRRMARLDDPYILNLVAAHTHTPSDTLRELAVNSDCLESLISNSSTPPDVLCSLIDHPSSETWPNTDRFLKNPATPPEVLLKIMQRTELVRLRAIVTHPNVTPAIIDSAMAHVDEALGREDLTPTDRYHCDIAMEKLAGGPLAQDKILHLASMTLPRTLVMLSRDPSVDAEILSKIAETCRGIPETDNHQHFFRRARECAQARLNATESP